MKTRFGISGGVHLTYYRGSVMIIICAVGEGLAPPEFTKPTEIEVKLKPVFRMLRLKITLSCPTVSMRLYS